MRSTHRARTLGRNAFAPENADSLDRLAYAATLALVAAGPLVAGTAPAGPLPGLPPFLGSALLNILAFLAAAAALLSRTARWQLRPLSLPLGALVCLTIFVVLQLLALPEEMMRQFASVNIQIYHETADILGLFGRREAPFPRISIAPGNTETSLLGLLGCLAVFLASAALMNSRARRRVFAGVVLVAGLLQAPFLLARGAAASPGPGDTFAASLWLGIALLVGFGSLWAALLTGADRVSDATDRGERFERRFTPIAVRGLVCLVLGTALVFCREPASTAGAAVALAAVLLLGAYRRRADLRRRAPGAIVALALIAAVALTAAASRPDENAGPPSNPTSRVDAVRATAIAAWREFPIVGAGLGNFRDAFRRVQPRELTGLVESAHSEPLELLVTTGVVGSALAVLLVASLLALLLRAWRAQRHREESAVVLAAFGALLFWVLAGLAESSPDSPSALPVLAAVVGTGWAASRARGERFV